MRIDRDARLYIYFDGEFDVDPAGATITLEIDNVSHPMEWMSTAVRTGVKTWKQTAKSTAMFLGSDKTAVGTDVLMAAGTHNGKPILTFPDGQAVPCYPAIEIKSY